jgi:hypothetical protein
VRFERFVFLAMLVVMLLTGGCGFIGNIFKKPLHTALQPVEKPSKTNPQIAEIREQERNFAGALENLRAGNDQEARDLLGRVCELPPLAGVTDEALFRLALLDLRDDTVKGIARSQELLDRLMNEFPNSIWTHQAEPLASLLAGVKTLRDKQSELKLLKEHNLSLSRDNRELRQTIERLKNLDIELEQKIKR